jgi:hypothetical protein
MREMDKAEVAMMWQVENIHLEAMPKVTRAA